MGNTSTCFEASNHMCRYILIAYIKTAISGSTCSVHVCGGYEWVWENLEDLAHGGIGQSM